MNKFKFLKLSTITPSIEPGNPLFNANQIVSILNTLKSDIAVFPELTLSGYQIGDLMYEGEFLEKVKTALSYILEKNTFRGVFVLGMPLYIETSLYNCAVVIQENKILGIIPKTHIPNYQEFYEYRWFTSGKDVQTRNIQLLGQSVKFGKMIFKDNVNNVTFGVELCEDMWAITPPSDALALAGAEIILNLSASSSYGHKAKFRKQVVLNHSLSKKCVYAYTSTGTFESSSEVVFAGHHIIADNGYLISETNSYKPESIQTTVDISIESLRYKRRQNATFRSETSSFKEKIDVVNYDIIETNDQSLSRPLNKFPFVEDHDERFDLEEINNLQVFALVKKLLSLPEGLRKLVIGISGGLDSTLAFLVADQAIKYLNLDKNALVCVTMPAKPTSNRSKKNAIDLVQSLGYKIHEISIEQAVNEQLKLINHDKLDVTYENAQARVRTLILMNLANKYGGIVLGTGDLSEIALGWMTYNGDQMSMYAINSGVPKTLVQALVDYHSKTAYKTSKDILKDILDMPISPELLDNQATENSIGSYMINDFILFHHLVEGHNEEIIKWFVKETFGLDQKEADLYVTRFMKRFYTQQFKRQTLPEGPKVIELSLSPRGQFRMPSDVNRK